MNEELENEIEAINSIYGDGSLVVAEDPDLYILHLPQQTTSLRIRFPPDYPFAPPTVLGSESSGENTRRGEAAHVVDTFRNALGNLFQSGEVCLFDVIEEVNNASSLHIQALQLEDNDHAEEDGAQEEFAESLQPITSGREPPWTLSEVVVEMKSVFIARSAPVASPEEANGYLHHLLDSDKKVRSATHNITAWRIKGDNGVTYQDCDDDGETAAGGRVLHLMQLMDIWNVMVVVTRWYGGLSLDRNDSVLSIPWRETRLSGVVLWMRRRQRRRRGSAEG